MTTGAFDLCSLAWGDKTGYVFLSVRDPRKDKEDKGYWRDIAYKWPDDRLRIQGALERAPLSKKDVYWAPAVFSSKRRDRHKVHKLNCLWADCDKVNPYDLPESLKPTAVWSTSDGHYQALWQLTEDLDPLTQSDFNKRLTYAIGADKGGWDITQVLRVPGTRNYKYDKQWVGEPEVNGSKHIDAERLSLLPSVEVVETTGQELNLEPMHQVIERHKVPPRALQIIRSRVAQVGTRSDRLWELECLLAEVGLNVSEIVSVVRPTVWNKFSGRRDELHRLATEAGKAIEHVPLPRIDRVIEVEDESRPVTWRDFDRDHRPIKWLVADVWGESEVGFISGLPKSYKSWLALDLAVSVTTGTRFLDSFQSRKSNVLLIQEEDPKTVMQDRLVRIAASKGLVYAKERSKRRVELLYNLPDNLFIVSNEGFQITSDEWFISLEEWINENEIGLVIMDPLMMMVEGVDEFKAFEVMANVFKPLKQLRARTQVAIAIVHHHTKSEKAAHTGAMMYGSVALWAWEEVGLHLSLVSPGKLTMERFSKHSRLSTVTVDVGDIQEQGWSPLVYHGLGGEGLLELLMTYEDGATVEEIVDETKLGRETILRQLRRLSEEGRVETHRGEPRPGQRGRPPRMWRAKRG